MADTYSQIYIQVVFAVRNRNALIETKWEEELYKYITGIIQNKGQKMLSINGTANHIHFLIGMKPSCCLSDLVREVKKSSNSFVKEKRFTSFSFNWQESFAIGFGRRRKDLVHSLIVIHNYRMLSITLKTKRNITKRKHSKKNIWRF